MRSPASPRSPASAAIAVLALAALGGATLYTQAGPASGIYAAGTSGLRLTLTSGTPVTTSDVATATTVYLTPHVSGQIGLYTGTVWEQCSTAEVSLAIGTLTSGKNYDVWAYDAGSCAVTLVLSAAWTSDTARSDAVGRQDGAVVKNTDHTRLLVGTLRTISTTQTTDTITQRFLWNAYNRVERVMGPIVDASVSWTYTTATTRPTHNSTTNRLQLVVGVADESVCATAHMLVGNDVGTAEKLVFIGIAVDATNTQNSVGGVVVIPMAGLGRAHLTAHLTYALSVGYHYLQQVENSDAVGTTTWYTNTLEGIQGSMRM